MTRIDFHFNTPEKLAYSCRLIRKAYRAMHRLWICSEDLGQLQQLDRMLWSVSAVDFIPHVMHDHPLAGRTPVVLSNSLEGSDAFTIAIHLGAALPQGFSSFERWIEVVGRDETDRQLARKRYALLREQGYPIHHFDLAEQGTEA
ncbi:MAG: DNA polymerase III subunit chi [Betaproteobacteria bacterium]|nr:DNA polymerase III subunit chi [Pseudomonadota bacterium]NBO12282.1 DNA polymerase III subunit chi [Betaproteobacteria bacterium]NBO44119.1 DNA polymerase III subunit chi [Betaproteobacteria bacterium]NBP09896.1 DNA polymerase III subunit chi [Betaproteobacteria bacterium]NBP61659.1 DNA polymerase III subunit chi [Betaproteobacteria bacterium]